MTEEEKYKVPKPDGKDALHIVSRAGLGAIPIGGAAASELLTVLVTPSLEKRRIAWMEEIAEGLRKAEEQHNINLEELAQNESFIDIVLQASQAALRTSQQEKLKAFRNAIINSATSNSPDEVAPHIFLNLVDNFTAWHLKILAFLKDPAHGGIPIRTGNTYIHLSVLPKSIEKTFPEIEGRYDFYNQIIKDLSDRGLVNMSASDTTHDMATMHGIPSTQVTELGAEFLSFIKSKQNC